MKRWHEERPLMLRRWRLEIATHERVPVTAVCLPPVADPSDCHCYRGMGFLRKKAPHDCGNPRCYLCHFEKFLERPCRETERRQAIDDQLK